MVPSLTLTLGLFVLLCLRDLVSFLGVYGHPSPSQPSPPPYHRPSTSHLPIRPPRRAPHITLRHRGGCQKECQKRRGQLASVRL
ncbi:hypothetical protein Pmani_036836 [Petrolisthes manimaculis]|uniref:Secreted protein n=1 Tax=Petrolisthes manimaculis TaxID=1843537 RepID=A0AAE1NKC4_9EUCA|nr:hypothetical protein Pmani_036836 [Petrolisthes manimaculis]